MQNYINIYHEVQKIGPGLLFQNLNLGKTSTNPKWHLTISCATLSISMCMQNFITIFHSVQEIGPFSFFFFQNLELSKASTEEKCHFAISWAKPCQYQFVCKSLSNDSKWFTSYRHFPLFGRGQNLHKLSGDKIKCLIIGYTLKVNL